MFGNRPAILFDLDGTLVDSATDLAATVNHLLERDGLDSLPLAEIRQMLGPGASVVLQRAYGRYGSQPPSDALERFRTHYRDHCTVHTRPYPGIVEMLGQLAGRSLAVVTNKPTDQAEKVVGDLGLSPLIPLVVGPELAERSKPAPEHLFAALKCLGRQPSEAVIVGDGTTDMLAGRDAGTATIAVLWGYQTREQLAPCGPNHMVETVSSLEELLTGT
ncbi:MAG: HAD-IA family hydrolase [bacterium]|nr:HAD-IA family hydrolase [bacterium]